MKPQRYFLISSVLGLVLLLAGCGNQGASSQSGPPVATSTITVQDNAFDPAAAEVAVGETVTWNWEGSNDHNVVGDGFQSDVQNDGSFTQQFDEPGTYEYRCALHGGMTGRVVVTSE
jgi:plastocyanin